MIQLLKDKKKYNELLDFLAPHLQDQMKLFQAHLPILTTAEGLSIQETALDKRREMDARGLTYEIVKTFIDNFIGDIESALSTTAQILGLSSGDIAMVLRATIKNYSDLTLPYSEENRKKKHKIKNNCFR